MNEPNEPSTKNTTWMSILADKFPFCLLAIFVCVCFQYSAPTCNACLTCLALVGLICLLILFIPIIAWAWGETRKANAEEKAADKRFEREIELHKILLLEKQIEAEGHNLPIYRANNRFSTNKKTSREDKENWK